MKDRTNQWVVALLLMSLATGASQLRAEARGGHGGGVRMGGHAAATGGEHAAGASGGGGAQGVHAEGHAYGHPAHAMGRNLGDKLTLGHPVNPMHRGGGRPYGGTPNEGASGNDPGGSVVQNYNWDSKSNSVKNANIGTQEHKHHEPGTRK